MNQFHLANVTEESYFDGNVRAKIVHVGVLLLYIFLYKMWIASTRCFINTLNADRNSTIFCLGHGGHHVTTI